MSGYDGDPSANQAAFAGDWFKTGDQGFFDDDGYLFHRGTHREIINRGGEKIAPQEVDEVLLEHPAVRRGRDLCRPPRHAGRGRRVGHRLAASPPAATPTTFAVCPRTRCRLQGPAPGAHRRRNPQRSRRARSSASAWRRSWGSRAIDVPQAFVAPRTRLEKMLAECWAEILQLEQVGIHDDFFGLGGNSLSVTHVLARVYEVTHLEIDVFRFFDAPTIAEMAHHLETLTPADQAARPSSAIARAPREGGLPASIAQERLCKLQLALPGLPFFNVLYALRLTSAFDAAILERSLNEIVRRHEILRTTFAVVEGRYVQVVAPQLTVPLRFDDLRALPKSEAGHRRGPRSFKTKCSTASTSRMVRCFELVWCTWPSGITSCSLPCTRSSATAGRSACSATSSSALYDAFLAGEPSPLAPLSIQYADFAYWQRQWQVTSRHRRAA